MAKFWEHLKYHEDKVEKHAISKEDIVFLMELQKEMNTQDTVGQANPRYWVIRDYEKFFGESLNDPSGVVVYYDGSEIVTVDYDGKGDREIINDAQSQLVNYFDISYPDDPVHEIYDIDTLKEYCEENDLTCIEYQYVRKYDNFFLTQKDAEDHLRSNYYHFDEDASTYAMTAWRNPRVERLYKILQETDWSSLLNG